MRLILLSFAVETVILGPSVLYSAFIRAKGKSPLWALLIMQTEEKGRSSGFLVIYLVSAVKVFTSHVQERSGQSERTDKGS